MSLDVIIISSILEDNMVGKEKLLLTINGKTRDIVDVVNLLIPDNKPKIDRIGKSLVGIYLKFPAGRKGPRRAGMILI